MPGENLNHADSICRGQAPGFVLKDCVMVLALVGRVVASGLLFWALADHAYAYFAVLRFVVCATAAYCAVLANSRKDEQWTWLFGAIAILYNPIFPIHLNRQIWSVIDPVVGVLMIASLFLMPKAKRT